MDVVDVVVMDVFDVSFSDRVMLPEGTTTMILLGPSVATVVVTVVVVKVTVPPMRSSQTDREGVVDAIPASTQHISMENLLDMRRKYINLLLSHFIAEQPMHPGPEPAWHQPFPCREQTCQQL